MREPLAIVTGASRGIGRHVVRGLAAKGFRVAALARSKDDLATLKAETGCDPVVVDASDGPALREVVQGLLARHAVCDLLVNNAGVGSRGAVEEIEGPAFRAQLELNVVAPVLLSQLVLPGMRARRRGTIVYVGSLAGHLSVPLSGGYAATKFALRAISDAQRIEVAPFGVSVVWVEPGPVKTAFAEVAASRSERVLTDPASPYRPVYERLAASLSDLHSGRAWEADEVARRLVDAATAAHPPAVVKAYGASLALARLARALMPRVFDALVARRMGFAALAADARPGRERP